jgi:thymidylate kinase
MRIAIDGADCTGKSTYCKTLESNNPDCTMIHVSGKPTKEFYDSFNDVNDIIFDRFVLGDIIYNNPRLLTNDEIIEFINTLDIYYILAPPRDLHFERCEKRGELTDYLRYRNDSMNFLREIVKLQKTGKIKTKVVFLYE